MTTASKSLSAGEARMLQRAQWLRSLSQAQRDELVDLPLRAVDAHFDAWLERSGGEAGGEAG
jgi:hypothetical protein